MGLIAAVYLLLALRVRICAQAAFSGADGSASLSMGAAGVELRFDGELHMAQDGKLVRFIPRYGLLPHVGRGGGTRRDRLRRAKGGLRILLRAGQIERAVLDVRLGLADAAQTAAAVGTLRAAGAAWAAYAGEYAPCIRIVPDFGDSGVAARACCIFSFQLGDIMLAALRGAAKKTGREGLAWKSIPLRA